jgi:hypothetical protein
MRSTDVHHDCRSQSLSGSCNDTNVGEIFLFYSAIPAHLYVYVGNFQTDLRPKACLMEISVSGMCITG